MTKFMYTFAPLAAAVTTSTLLTIAAHATEAVSGSLEAGAEAVGQPFTPQVVQWTGAANIGGLAASNFAFAPGPDNIGNAHWASADAGQVNVTNDGMIVSQPWRISAEIDGGYTERWSYRFVAGQNRVLGMSQRHYLDSIRDDGALDPLFKILLKRHWTDEAQHAKLDTLIVEALVDRRNETSVDTAIDDYLEIGAFLDAGVTTQTGFNLDAVERAIGRLLDEPARNAILTMRHQAARWTYLGSEMTHPKFRATLGSISPAALDRIDPVAPAFA